MYNFMQNSNVGPFWLRKSISVACKITLYYFDDNNNDHISTFKKWLDTAAKILKLLMLLHIPVECK